MPKYNYVCQGCDDRFDMSLHSKNRKDPCELPCKKCGENKVGITIMGVHTVSGVKEPNETPPMFRNLMKEIHKKAGPRSAMDV